MSHQNQLLGVWWV